MELTSSESLLESLLVAQAEVLKQLGHFRHLFVKCVAQASEGDRGFMPIDSSLCIYIYI